VILETRHFQAAGEHNKSFWRELHEMKQGECFALLSLSLSQVGIEGKKLIRQEWCIKLCK